MGTLRVAAVQASYVLMNRDACIDKVERLTAEAVARGAQVVVFPEAFVPGTPIWIDTRPIWDGDDEWYALLHVDHIPPDFPDRDKLVPPAYLEENGPWIEPGSSLMVAPNGTLLAG